MILNKQYVFSFLNFLRLYFIYNEINNENDNDINYYNRITTMSSTIITV